jgi:hypothetical protein
MVKPRKRLAEWASARQWLKKKTVPGRVRHGKSRSWPTYALFLVQGVEPKAFVGVGDGELGFVGRESEVAAVGGKL